MKRKPGRKVFDAVSTTGTTAYTSDEFDLGRSDMLSATLKFVRASGTYSGTLIFEVNNSPAINVNLNTETWVQYLALTVNGTVTGVSVSNGTITLSTTTTITELIEIVDIAAGRGRWTYTNATGTGTITLEQTIKGRG